MPETYVVTFGPNGEITAAGNAFHVDGLGNVTLNGITQVGDYINIDGDFRWVNGGPVLKSPNSTLYRIKVDNDGNIGTENA